jgi:transcriptional regulator with XRE-family HTH domain
MVNVRSDETIVPLVSRKNADPEVKKLLPHLQKFIREQMNVLARSKGIEANSLAMQEFADTVKVSQSTISRLLDENDPPEPTFTSLVRLARATKTDIRDIVALISPEDVLHGSSSAAVSLAVRLLSLSDEDYQLADKFITGANATSTKRRDKS